MYKHRWLRLKKQTTPVQADTPRTKTRELLGHQQVVRRTLDYHHALTRAISEKYKECRKHKDKHIIAQVVISRISKKYNKIAALSLGISKGKSTAFKSGRAVGSLLTTKKWAASKNAEIMKQEIRKFYMRDDVSGSTTGKKETITKNQEKKQKRFLTDTLENLYRRFMSEYHGKVSYNLFCRLRPYWMLIPSVSDRNTCLCKTPENLSFKANELKQLKTIDTEDLEKLLDGVTCDVLKKECMYGECAECKDAILPSAYDRVTSEDEIWCRQWATKSEERERKRKTPQDDQVDGTEKYTTHFTVKEEKYGTVAELADKFNDDLLKMKKHAFNIKRQYKMYREIRENLKDEEALLHTDFAEKYGCKYATELQSVHFGAGHQPAALHTGVCYI